MEVPWRTLNFSPFSPSSPAHLHNRPALACQPSLLSCLYDAGPAGQHLTLFTSPSSRDASRGVGDVALASATMSSTSAALEPWMRAASPLTAIQSSAPHRQTQARPYKIPAAAAPPCIRRG
jgi:hypothetical protein